MARLSLAPARAHTLRILRAAAPLALFAAMTASCLITSTPSFQPPAQTPPFFIEATADPPLGELYILDPDKPHQFRATVRSQDDPGSTIEVRLFLDYGFEEHVTDPSGNLLKLPYSQVKDGNTLPAAASFNDLTRQAQATLFGGSSSFVFTRSCHRITLMVSHKFDNTPCPVDLADSALLSWNVVICPNGQCPTVNPTQDCAPPQSADGTGKPYVCQPSTGG